MIMTIHTNTILYLVYMITINDHAQVALGMPGFPLWLYHLAECFCHLGLAASVFLTIAITIERYQVRMMTMVMMMIGRCSDKLKFCCRL